MVIAAGAEKRGGRSQPRRQLEAEHAVVERERAIEIGDFQVDVADVDAGIDGSAMRSSYSGDCGPRTLDLALAPRTSLMYYTWPPHCPVR
jgi:hypothetical protein